MHTDVFELARPLYVLGLVEARFDFDEHSDLFALAGGFDQRFNDWRVAGCAIESLLDRKYLRVSRCLIEEVDEGLEALVGVV